MRHKSEDALKALAPAVIVTATRDAWIAMMLTDEQQPNPLDRTLDLLGGVAVLKRKVRNSLEAHDALRDGLPGAALRHLVTRSPFLSSKGGALEKAVGISLRTYQRRQNAPDDKLSAEQSGRTWTFAEVLGRATAVFGSQDVAESWLQRPALALDGRKPIDLLSSPAGVESVETLLGRIEYGVYT